MHHKLLFSDLQNSAIRQICKKILFADKNFFGIIIIYGIFIAFLSLAVPLSVQLLINSVIFTALLQPIIVLGFALFALLAFSSVLNAMQYVACELFQRRFFARMSAEITSQLIKVNHVNFEEINHSEFANRFFEVFAIQKTLPKILTKTVALLLQILTGLILVMFYHPALLLLSLVIIVCMYLIWRMFARQAFLTKFFTSRKKYEMASWLEDISCNYIFFKSASAQNYAKIKTNRLTKEYLSNRKNHFAKLFSQVVLMLILYSIASALLLIIGGYLVLKGQLSIGQLVASELVLSASFYGISQLGKDLDDFYDLVASCEKLSQFYNIPSEATGIQILESEELTIDFKNVFDSHLGKKFTFDFHLEAHKNYIISSQDLLIQKLLIELISGLRKPIRGSLCFNKISIEDINLAELRSKIAMIDNSLFIDGLVIDYLTLNDPSISRKQLNEILHITGLEQILAGFKEGLQLRITPSGWPFSESEKILLKTARALLQEPQIIVITEALDMLQLTARKKILDFLTKDHNAMVLYFSNRRDDMMNFDYYLFITSSTVRQFASLTELDNFEKQNG